MSKNNQSVLVLQTLIRDAMHRINNGECPSLFCFDPCLALDQLGEASRWLTTKFDFDTLSAECAAMEAGK